MGGVYLYVNGTATSYVIVQKPIKGCNRDIYNCYSLFDCQKKELSFHPCILEMENFTTKIGEFPISYYNQIEHYKPLFIDLMPEYFI